MWHHYQLLAQVVLLGGAYCREDNKSIFRDSTTLTLRKGDLPAANRSILIENVRQVTVEEDAVKDLHALSNITLAGVERLVIRQGGLSLRNGSQLLYITIRNVGHLRIEGSAFSGSWRQTATVRFHNINNLTVESNAFDYQPGEISPTVALQHVKLLNLDRDGLAAPLFGLALNNITMDVCHEKSFGGNVIYNEFSKVTIDVAKPGCFYGRNDFTYFDIEYLNINTVSPQAFSGTFNQLTIKDSQFTTIQEKGFNISVTKMEITSSHIKDLLSDGLTVFAKETSLLERVHIGHLRQNGLVGLKMRKEVKGLVPMLTVRDLELLKMEPGSLTFSECTKLQLTDLRLMATWPRICPTEKWTQYLSGGGVSGQLSSAQYQVFFQLWDGRYCLEDRWRKMPRTVESPHCKAETTTSLDDPEHTAAPSQDGQDAPSEDDGSHGDKSGQGDSDGDDLPREGKEASEGTVSADVREMPAPGESQTKAASSESEESHLPAESSSDVGDSGDQELSHNRLLLRLVAGAVLVLFLVMGAVLVLWLKRPNDHDRRQSANVRDVVLTAMLENLVEGSNNRLEKGTYGVRSGDTGRNSTRSSVEYHQYEVIRDDLSVQTGEGPLMTSPQDDALSPRWSRPLPYFGRPEV